MPELNLCKDLSLPINAVTQKFAIIGMSGSGKSYCMTKLAELMLDAAAQVVLLDPKGEAWGLRLLADGKRPGYSVPVFGGEHADVPLKPDMGKQIADLIVRGDYSAILDVSEFVSSEIAEFGYHFATQLLHLKKARPGAMHVMIDEAQDFIPQNPQPASKGQSNYEPRMLHAFERLQKQGRAKGVGMTIAGQRPQEINKKVLNLSECWITFRLAGLQERASTLKIIGERDRATADKLDQQLPRLASGDGYFWSAEWLKVSGVYRVAAKKTFDSSATPEVGARRVEPRELSPVDNEALRREMAAVIEQEEENNPATLRARLAAQEAELKKLRAQEKPAAEIKRVEIPVLKEADFKRIEQSVREMEAIRVRGEEANRAAINELNSLAEKIAGAASLANEADKQLLGTMLTVSLPVPVRSDVEQYRQATDAIARQTAPRRSAGKGVGSAPVKAGARRMLEALSRYRRLGLTRPQLATLSFVAPGGTFSDYLSSLRAHNFISEDGVHIHATDLGIAHLIQARGDAPTAAFDAERIVAAYKLKAGARRMMDVLLKAHPSVVTRGELSIKAAVAPGGTFSDYLSSLRVKGLISEDSSGIKASATLYLK